MAKEYFIATPRSGKASKENFAAAAMALTQALDHAVRMLAEVKGTDDLSWLDELHQAALRDANGSIAEGVSIEIESEALQFGVDVIDASFQANRARLIKARDK